MDKIEMPEGRLLQPGPTSPVVMATCVDKQGNPNIITLGMYMSISHRPPQVCIGECADDRRPVGRHTVVDQLQQPVRRR